VYEHTFATRSGDARDAGLDVSRVIALLGIIVVNYHGYLNGVEALGTNQTNPLLRLVDPWNGALVFSPVVFVIVSGIGCALLTRGARESNDAVALTTTRWILIRRGMGLLLAGLVFEWIWAGTILPYFGIYFLLAAFVFSWRGRAIAAIAIASMISAAALSWWRYQREVDGHSTAWLSPRWVLAPRDLFFRLFIDYTHPVFPWFAYFCTGLIIGRAWGQFAERRRLVTAACAVIAAVVFSVSALALHLSDGLAQHLLSTDPFRRGILATVGHAAIGVGLVALVTMIVDKFSTSRWVKVTQVFGASTLTMYVVHALVFNLVIHWLGWIEPAGFDVAALFGLTIWTAMFIASVAWTKRFGRTPLEVLLRRIGG